MKPTATVSWAIGCVIGIWGSCAGGGDAGLVSLSITSPDSLEPAVGEEVRLVVRAIHGDGSSDDVTAAATCELDSQMPPGTLAEATFVAERPGTADIACSYRDARGSVAVTVQGLVETSAAAVQAGQVPEGTRVELELVVYALDRDRDYTNLFAQDEGGGEKSGIYLRDVRELTMAQVGVDPAAIGDVVRIAGSYLERAGRTTIEYDTIEVVGSATPVATTLELTAVDPSVWDSSFIAIEDVVVAQPMIDDYTWSVAAQAAPDGVTLLVETLLYDPPRSAGLQLSRLAGPLYLFLDEADALHYAIAPRGAEDLEGDSSRVDVADLHAGDVPEGTELDLAGLVVTALDRDANGNVDMFAQDPRGGPASGVYLVDQRSPPSPVAVGDVIDVTGVYIVIRTRHTIDVTALRTTGMRAPMADMVAVGTELAPYQSSLVRIEDVRVSDPMLDPYTYEVSDGTETMRIDTLLYDGIPSEDDAVASITGVVFCGETYCALAPRSAADVEVR